VQIDSSDVKLCGECKAEVLLVKTSRMSKGKPVWVMVDPDPTPPAKLASNIKNDYALSRVGGEIHAGQPATRGQRSAMVARGVEIHALHEKAECNKRKAVRH
jgi:hypothetical protein